MWSACKRPCRPSSANPRKAARLSFAGRAQQHPGAQYRQTAGGTGRAHPAKHPPALDRALPYDIYEATRFLYTGSAPAQTGVTNGIIDRRCVAALRGSVIDQDGQPLPGVVVAIKDQPDFGQTLTDANGVFNLVLNGGKTVVVEYEKSGYLSVQRQVVTQRRQFDALEAVVLIPPDPQTTLIDPGIDRHVSGSPGQRHQRWQRLKESHPVVSCRGPVTTYLERAE
ncbi:carboxypeptidase-like regulatory domain-containing protein [Candidatus Amarobacter glycogenicus]|uniref:carboxypeptidase-like regulatory domain-containing protein n=1 Tax=Candidatus Amarobacter glycogenicus TaxID=3140699 RepID=UPI002A145020|nr:carboxypeptidase regulatory-like domain-containing protein [Dehalococcoidia bacterium]